jgi:hypothetical protein
MNKLAAALAGALASLAFAGTAHAETTFGVADDAGKHADDGGVAFCALLGDLGMAENRMTVQWDPANPTTIPDQVFLDRALPRFSLCGVRVIFAVYPSRSRGLSETEGAAGQFVLFLHQLARTYPYVKHFVVGNEFNQPRFFQPQFDASCRASSAAAYVGLLAQAYDALKAVDPRIVVISSVSPRGNDNCRAPNNVSTSPVRFIRDMGAAYRKLGRTWPLFDEFGQHVYPNQPVDSLTKGYGWPNIGIPNLDRLKQAVWDAFHGTGQPTFEQGLRVRLGEVGWQVGVVPSAAGAYHGQENVQVTTETAQAEIYGELVRRVVCDPHVGALHFFGLVDEKNLDRFQAGLIRADGTTRPSYDAVKTAIAETQGRCAGRSVSWRHVTSVIGAEVEFGNLSRRQSPKRLAWNFSVSADEETTYRAGIFRLPAGREAIVRTLTAASAGGLVASASGLVKAYYKPLVQFRQRLRSGSYVYAVRLAAAMNPARTSVFVSRPFRVGTGKR